MSASIEKTWNIWHFQPDGNFFSWGICLLTSWACTTGIWSTLAQLNWLDKFTSYVINLLDLQYFCRHNPLFYHLNLIPCHYWSWQRNIYFLVNIFVRHTFSMSKSSIKTKTVLTMTDMTESTELLAFKRLKPFIFGISRHESLQFIKKNLT